jgi:hypothetical protein
MNFRLWLEGERPEFADEQENDDRPSVFVLMVWDDTPGAGGAGGDYDPVTPSEYAKHLGISTDTVHQDYSGDWNHYMGRKSLPDIEGRHYGYKAYITPEADHMLIGNEAYILPDRYVGYAHSHQNSAEVIVIVKPEQIDALKPHLKPKGHYAGRIMPMKDQRPYFGSEDAYPALELKWDGLTNMIKRITKKQDMEPPASMYSQKWAYTAGIDPKLLKLFPGPKKPTAKDPRTTTPRMPGESSADWLVRAVREMKRKKEAEDRKLGGNWE